MHKLFIKIILLNFIIAIVAAFYIFELREIFNLEYLKYQQYILFDFYQQNKLMVIIIFSLLYVFVTAFSIPAATILTLLAGAMFGFLTGLIIVSFASTIGASCAFLMSRFILHDTIKSKFSKYINIFYHEFAKEGAFYLFALRLVPVVPFFVINIVMGVLPIRLVTFFLISQLGMLPGTAVYVYAGTELSKINQISDILSPTLLISFALLGIFPIISKKLLQWLRKNKEYV